MIRSESRYRAADLAAIDDETHRYEIIDGSLVVTPYASAEHQRTVARLLRQLDAATTSDLLVLPGAELRLGDDVVIPDIVVVRDQPVLPTALGPDEVRLVLEVTSPGQENRDLVTKRVVFERAGIPLYVVAEPARISVLAIAAAGRYETLASGEKVGLPAPFSAACLTVSG